MKNIIEQILDENNNDNLKIKSDAGEMLEFEQVALINLEEEIYTILHPIANDFLPDDVLVFRIVYNDPQAELVLEENEDIINECFDAYYKMLKTKKKK